MLCDKHREEKLASSVSWYAIHLLPAGGFETLVRKMQLPSILTGINTEKKTAIITGTKSLLQKLSCLHAEFLFLLRRN
jgi:hypothetical protein